MRSSLHVVPTVSVVAGIAYSAVKPFAVNPFKSLLRVTMLPSSTPPSLLRQFSQLYRPTSPPISQLPKFRRIGNRHSNNGTHGNGFRNYSSSTAYPMSASQLRLNEQRTNIRTTIYYTMSVFVGFIGLTYAAVPLYKMLCTETGVDGTPLTSIGHKFEATSMVPVAHSNPIRIIFDSSIADTMQWKFVPETRQIQVVPGETALAFFRASNPGAEDMVGISTYSVTPAKAAQYFNKIQCFCFEEQKLVSGEEIDMPVFFYIDPEFAYDPWMSDVKTITLHYTFFKSKYQ